MIAAFDIGIKNLAWCIYDPVKKQIQHWENTNLMDDAQPVSQAKKGPVCISCSKTAKYVTAGKKELFYYCGRHCPGSQPAAADLTKLPAVSVLQELLTAKTGTACKLKKRSDLIQKLGTYYSLPLWAAEYLITDEMDSKFTVLPAKKAKKATALSFDELHDNIITFVTKNIDKFKQCTRVLLENQPVLKNPVMKTVQVFLYGELRSALIRAGVKPSFELVHAKKKVADAEKGDAGYADRKKGSEARAVDALDAAIKTGCTVAKKWKEAYTAAKKKSDLADAYCMVMDAAAA